MAASMLWGHQNLSNTPSPRKAILFSFCKILKNSKVRIAVLSKWTSYSCRMLVFQCYHFSKQFFLTYERLNIWLFHNISLCCKSCKNGYSDKQHCNTKNSPNGDPQVRVFIYKGEPAWTHALEGPHIGNIFGLVT